MHTAAFVDPHVSSSSPGRFILTGMLIGLLLAGLAGCAAPAKEASAQKNPEKENEYVYITPTGSNIPVRVRKDQAQTTDSASTQDQNTLRNIQLRTNKVDKQPGGG